MARGFRLTRAGWGLFTLTLALALATVMSGNNLHVLILAVLLAGWIVEGVLGRLNLLGVDVRRVLEGDCYEGVSVVGHYVVANRRGGPAPRDLAVLEMDGEGAVEVEYLPRRAEQEIRSTWMFGRRGRAQLNRIRLLSRYPFGLVERWRRIQCPGEWVVYPRPRAGWSERDSGRLGGDGRLTSGTGTEGDPYSLREYQVGDPLTQVHWPTTARTGQLMTIVRRRSNSETLRVTVRGCRGPAWEVELSRACGQILWGFRRGYQVGLELPGEVFDPAHGEFWRHQLLEALALQPQAER